MAGAVGTWAMGPLVPGTDVVGLFEAIMIDAAEPAPEESDAESSASEANQAGVAAGIMRISDSDCSNGLAGVAAKSRRSSSRSAARPA